MIVRSSELLYRSNSCKKGLEKQFQQWRLFQIFSHFQPFALHWYVMIIPVNNNSLKNCCCLFWTLVYMRYFYVWFWAEFLNFLFTQSIWCPISEIPPEVGNEHFLDHYMIFRLQVLNFVWEVYGVQRPLSFTTINLDKDFTFCSIYFVFISAKFLASVLHGLLQSIGSENHPAQAEVTLAEQQQRIDTFPREI